MFSFSRKISGKLISRKFLLYCDIFQKKTIRINIGNKTTKLLIGPPNYANTFFSDENLIQCI